MAKETHDGTDQPCSERSPEMSGFLAKWQTVDPDSADPFAFWEDLRSLPEDERAALRPLLIEFLKSRSGSEGIAAAGELHADQPMLDIESAVDRLLRPDHSPLAALLAYALDPQAFPAGVPDKLLDEALGSDPPTERDPYEMDRPEIIADVGRLAKAVLRRQAKRLGPDPLPPDDQDLKLLDRALAYLLLLHWSEIRLTGTESPDWDTYRQMFLGLNAERKRREGYRKSADEQTQRLSERNMKIVNDINAMVEKGMSKESAFAELAKRETHMGRPRRGEAECDEGDLTGLFTEQEAEPKPLTAGGIRDIYYDTTKGRKE